MKKYEVTVYKDIQHTGTIEVQAESRAQAMSFALEMLEQEDVFWESETETCAGVLDITTE